MKGHEEDDARWMAAQGVDYLKVDDMSGQPKTQAGATADYGKIRDALNATVRNNDLTSCWFSLFKYMTAPEVCVGNIISIRIKSVLVLVQGRPILFSTCGHSPDGTTADKMRAEGCKPNDF